jgi:hypothetical protein
MKRMTNEVVDEPALYRDNKECWSPFRGFILYFQNIAQESKSTLTAQQISILCIVFQSTRPCPPTDRLFPPRPPYDDSVSFPVRVACLTAFFRVAPPAALGLAGTLIRADEATAAVTAFFRLAFCCAVPAFPTAPACNGTASLTLTVAAV